MDDKDGGWDLSDLEREIEAAVDQLFVEKKPQADPVARPDEDAVAATEAEAVKESPPSPVTPPSEELRLEDLRLEDLKPEELKPEELRPSEELRLEELKPEELKPEELKPEELRPSEELRPRVEARPKEEGPLAARELQEKLEEVEAQLLTLEWDINSKHINRAINLLQGLRKLPSAGRELDEVIVLIEKVLYQLLLDENKLAPTALKFVQKSWRAVKGMTNVRLASQIDKKTLVGELKAQFQRLRLEEAAPPKERIEDIRERKEEVVTTKPPEETGIAFETITGLMDRIQGLEKAVGEERKRLENIQQEIESYKAELQQQRVRSQEEFTGVSEEEEEEEEIVELDERLEGESLPPPDVTMPQPAKMPVVTVSLFEASGAVFGILEDHIVRTFTVKKWVADFFIKSGRVKLKDREIPLLNLFQVFRLDPSVEENPLVILVKGKENQAAAVIVDQAVSREELECHPVERKPYLLGKGISGKEEVWILDVEQIFL